MRNEPYETLHLGAETFKGQPDLDGLERFLLSVGLADWFTLALGRAHTTTLRQSASHLYLIVTNPEGIFWGRYADKHGMKVERFGFASSLEEAKHLAETAPKVADEAP